MRQVSSKLARRVVVISDLHLGGAAPAMCSRPDVLAAFIEQMPSICRRDEQVELVIAGDFVDFLALEPVRAWTGDEHEAVRKLGALVSDPRFSAVFDALGCFIQAGHRLTILVGNHDVELALPRVQEALLEAVGAASHNVAFVDDGRAYRIGNALIEHGNLSMSAAAS